MLKRTAATLLASLALAGCSTAEPKEPAKIGETVTGPKVNYGKTELTATYLGKVDDEELYTLCVGPDRLYLWSTYLEGSIAVHTNDATCKN